jgi:hypothetical protein
MGALVLLVQDSDMALKMIHMADNHVDAVC